MKGKISDERRESNSIPVTKYRNLLKGKEKEINWFEKSFEMFHNIIRHNAFYLSFKIKMHAQYKINIWLTSLSGGAKKTAIKINHS